MKVKLAVTLTDQQTKIEFSESQGTIDIIEKLEQEIKVIGVYLKIQGERVVEVAHSAGKEVLDIANADKLIIITPPWDVELPYITQRIKSGLLENGVPLMAKDLSEINPPKSSAKVIEDYYQRILTVLERFGFDFKPKEIEKPSKKKAGKAQHRWREDVSEIEFSTTFRGSQATVLWQKRSEMLLKAGAKMMPEAPLNKDGSVGFSAKMGEKIRSDNQGKFREFITTEDIVLKSVNEVGLFLYFGGTNSWLELVDNKGESLDEWTRVD